MINGKPLISYVIDAAKDANCFDEIWVNSESDILSKIANENGVNFYRRKKELCEDNVGSDLFVEDFIKNIECDIIVQILPTSPFITKDQISDFVTKSKNVDTLISTKSIRIESLFNGKPINFDKRKPTPPSQDLAPVDAYACSLMSWNTNNYIQNMKHIYSQR